MKNPPFKEPINARSYQWRVTSAPSGGAQFGRIVELFNFGAMPLDRIRGTKELKLVVNTVSSVSHQIYFILVEQPMDSAPAASYNGEDIEIETLVTGLDATNEQVRYKLLKVGNAKFVAAYWSTAEVLKYSSHNILDLTKWAKDFLKRTESHVLNSLEADPEGRNFAVHYLLRTSVVDTPVITDCHWIWKYTEVQDRAGGL